MMPGYNVSERREVLLGGVLTKNPASQAPRKTLLSGEQIVPAMGTWQRTGK
jgi:hypothetical protein